MCVRLCVCVAVCVYVCIRYPDKENGTPTSQVYTRKQVCLSVCYVCGFVGLTGFLEPVQQSGLVRVVHGGNEEHS